MEEGRDFSTILKESEVQDGEKGPYICVHGIYAASGLSREEAAKDAKSFGIVPKGNNHTTHTCESTCGVFYLKTKDPLSKDQYGYLKPFLHYLEHNSKTEWFEAVCKKVKTTPKAVEKYWLAIVPRNVVASKKPGNKKSTTKKTSKKRERDDEEPVEVPSAEKPKKNATKKTNKKITKKIIKKRERDDEDEPEEPVKEPIVKAPKKRNNVKPAEKITGDEEEKPVTKRKKKTGKRRSKKSRAPPATPPAPVPIAAVPIVTTEVPVEPAAPAEVPVETPAAPVTAPIATDNVPIAAPVTTEVPIETPVTAEVPTVTTEVPTEAPAVTAEVPIETPAPVTAEVPIEAPAVTAEIPTTEKPDFIVFDAGQAGKGLKANRNFPKDNPVLKYVGELITREEGEERERAYEEKGEGSYLFFFSKNGEHKCIDSTKTDHVSRFINHSKSNANLMPVVNDDFSIEFWAIERIRPGTELLFNYGDKRKEVVEKNPWLKE